MARQDTTRDLHGKVVVLTGASSGFGKGAALKFAEAGASLALAARRGELIEEVARECEAKGARAVAVPTDVSKADEVAQLAKTALREFGRIDVWVNNAGVGAIGRFGETPLADHVKVIETDLLGTLYGSWHAYRQFVRQGDGVLINISSELGKNSVPYYASYTAAKHGIVGLDDSLRQEVEQSGRDGIHVCTILPTAHDTPFFDHAANHTGHETKPPKPLHDPQKVVDAIVAIARNPKDEVVVGGDGPLKVLMSRLLPGMADQAGAKMMHKTQMEQAPPGLKTSGAVRQSSTERDEIDRGRRNVR